MRDEVFRACTQLKDYTRQSKYDQDHVNEDLSVKRAVLAHRTCQSKHQKQVVECWIYAGRVLVKTSIGMKREGDRHGLRPSETVRTDKGRRYVLLCYLLLRGLCVSLHFLLLHI